MPTNPNSTSFCVHAASNNESAPLFSIRQLTTDLTDRVFGARASWCPLASQTHERGGFGGSGESNVSLAHLYGNRALVHVCLGDDGSALDDLDRAVARDTRNMT